VHIEESLELTGGMISSAATHLGSAYAKIEATDLAVAVFRAAAEALANAGRHRGAVETLERLIEISPNDLEARKSLARSHLALGDVNRAIAQLRRVGSVLGAAGRWEDARAIYDEMLCADPGCPEAHQGLAHALLELSEVTDASKHFHRAALLYRGHGNVDAAVPFFREAVSKNPANADLLEEYAELLLATDHRDEKLHALSALVELRMARQEPARAAITLTRILEIDPRYPGAKSILLEAARQLSCLAETSEEIPAAVAKAIIDSAKAESPAA
jgi:tetratricopeptide (TPR) repeat protein